MKPLILVACIMTTSAINTVAQTDSIKYIQGLPMTGEDTIQQVLNDLPPKNVLIEIPIDKIPEKLRRTLTKDSLYKGWENFPIYRDDNAKLYILSIVEGNTTRTFGFSESGKPITYRESTKKESP